MKYEIKTLADILKVITAENIDVFLVDFKSWLEFNMLIEVIKKAMEKEGLISLPNHGTMSWIDDGKNNVSIKLEVTTAPLSPSPL